MPFLNLENNQDLKAGVCRTVFGPGRSAEPELELSRSWAGETQGLGITKQIGGLGSHIRDRP